MLNTLGIQPSGQLTFADIEQVQKEGDALSGN